MAEISLGGKMGTDTLHPLVAQDIEAVAALPLPWDNLRGATVLISGAGGMAGAYLLYTLLRLNDKMGLNIRVTALVRNPGKAKAKLGTLLDRSDVTLLTQDICTPILYHGSADYIFHAASPANPKYFSTDPVGTINANALGTYHLLELARQTRAKKFVLLSSAEVYGRASGDAPLGEDASGIVDSAAARSCYPESKRLAETYCAAYQQQYGIRCHAARIAHMYGPSMDRDDGHVIAEFIRCLLDGRDIVLKSDGAMRRAYIYISDVIAGLYTVLLRGEAPVYNITNEGQVVSIRELAETVMAADPDKKMRLLLDIPPAAANTGFLSHGVGLMNAARLRSLGWVPEVAISDGIARTAAVLRG